MTAAHYFRTAHHHLYGARRLLDTGKAVYLAPGDIRTAMLWGMEGWLQANGNDWDRGRGWNGVIIAFASAAPPDIRSPVLACLASASFLERDLSGGGSDDPPPLPIARWQEAAFRCLEEAEHALILLTPLA